MELSTPLAPPHKFILVTELLLTNNFLILINNIFQLECELIRTLIGKLKTAQSSTLNLLGTSPFFALLDFGIIHF